jgi:serine protease Do
MTGWALATAATALLGAAAIAPGTYVQSLQQAQDDSTPIAVPELEQVFQVFKGSGSQIGVTIRDLTNEDLKGKAGSGVVIEEVEADSPAAKAGFRAGDVVVEFDGERVRGTRQFTRLVQETVVGRQVQAAVLRDGQRVTLNVEPRAWGGYKDLAVLRPGVKPKIPPPATKWEVFSGLLGTGRLGMTVDDLSPQLAEYFGTKEGVLVKSVNDNSVASKTGLRAGDVITAIDGGAVKTSADLRRRTQRLEDGDEFTLSVIRDKKTLTLKGKMEAPQTRLSTRTIL